MLTQAAQGMQDRGSCKEAPRLALIRSNGDTVLPHPDDDNDVDENEREDDDDDNDDHRHLHY